MNTLIVKKKNKNLKVADGIREEFMKLIKKYGLSLEELKSLIKGQGVDVEKLLVSLERSVKDGIVLQDQGKKEKYMEFFKGLLEKYGVDSPAELSEEDKKKFFTEVEKEWKEENNSDAVLKRGARGKCNINIDEDEIHLLLKAMTFAIDKKIFSGNEATMFLKLHKQLSKPFSSLEEE